MSKMPMGPVTDQRVRRHQAHRNVRVLCILDREDIVSAAKFVLCRTAALPKYEHDLMAAFKPFHYTLGSEWEDYFCVVLTPHPRIASIRVK